MGMKSKFKYILKKNFFEISQQLFILLNILACIFKLNIIYAQEYKIIGTNYTKNYR